MGLKDDARLLLLKLDLLRILIKIPLDEWFKQGLAPQLLLAVQVDDENNVVEESGEKGGGEKEEIVNESKEKYEVVEFPVNPIVLDVNFVKT